MRAHVASCGEQPVEFARKDPSVVHPPRHTSGFVMMRLGKKPNPAENWICGPFMPCDT
jgi:hypothetical protein